ncbi:hypothetical protein TI39_contig489g00002 [Zymoseptoria brevis]|uniref:Helicase ATP-binding domain-containing protein n=1 Tax=Zymoseptoria brevis TaxID=1047168 RepID=A0A0F4GJ74_9PEZI|nr:hypothetical protein TI39_contig489g00002 [Zymoseptoria brevis]
MPPRNTKFETKDHTKVVKEPIGSSGPVTKCSNRNEIAGYFGMNLVDDTITKKDILRVVGQPIIMRIYNELDDVKKHLDKHIGPTTIRELLPFLWNTHEREAADDNESVEKRVGKDKAEAKTMYDYDNIGKAEKAGRIKKTKQAIKDEKNARVVKTENVNKMLGSLLWHWAKELLLLNTETFDDDDMTEIYARVTPEDLPEEYRNMHLENWPVGLQHALIQDLGESPVELMNRLWQLLSMMRSNIFTTKGKKEWFTTAAKPIPKSETGAHSPKWWAYARIASAKGVRLTISGPQAREALSKKYFQEQPLPAIGCFLKVTKLDSEEVWDDVIKGFADEDEVLPVFPGNGTRVDHPILQHGSLEAWRNSLRILLHVEEYILAIVSITISAIDEEAHAVGEEIFSREGLNVSRTAVTEFFKQHPGASKIEVGVTVKFNKSKGDSLEVLPFGNQYISRDSDGRASGKLDRLFDEPAPNVTPQAPADQLAAPTLRPDISPAPVTTHNTKSPQSTLAAFISQPALSSLDTVPPTDTWTSTPGSAHTQSGLNVPPSPNSHPSPAPRALPEQIQDAFAAHRDRAIVEGAASSSVLDASTVDMLTKWLSNLGLPMLEPNRFIDLESESNMQEPPIDCDDHRAMRKADFQSMATQALESTLADAQARKHARRGTKNELFNGRTPTDVIENDPDRTPEEMITQEYNGIDTRTHKGLVQWIKLALKTLGANTSTSDDAATYGQNLSKAANRTVDKVTAEGKRRIVVTEGDDDLPHELKETDTEALLQPSDRDVERSLSGLAGREGPPFDASAKLLGMVKERLPYRGDIYNYRSPKLMANVDAEFLPSQITAIVHMLISTCGYFPFSAEQKEEIEYYKQVEEDLNYPRPEVRGGILADAPGMGKTRIAGAVAHWLGQHHIPLADNGNPLHRPIVLICPDGHLFKQWVIAMNDQYETLEIILAKTDFEWVSEQIGDASEFEKPIRFHLLERAEMLSCQPPPHLEYIFEKANPRASRTMILCTYSTWRARMMTTRLVSPEEIQMEREKRNLGDEDELELPENWDFGKFDKTTKKRPIFAHEMNATANGWVDRIGMIFLDEGHQIRNNRNMLHWSIRFLKAPVVWLLTATPIINRISDIAQETKLIWQGAEKRLRNHEHWSLIEERYEAALDSEDDEAGMKFWDWLSAEGTTIGGQLITKDSIWRLLYLQPQFLIEVFETKDLIKIAKYFEHFDEVMSIRRSRDSTLPGYEGGTLPLNDIMIQHETITASIDFADENDRKEFLAWHRLYTQNYAKICHDYGTRGGGKKTSDSPPAVAGPLRRMTIATTSNILSRLTYYMENCVIGGDTKVGTINDWRKKGMDVMDLLTLTHLDKPLPKRLSRIQRLEHVAKSSPKALEIFRHVGEIILPKEDQPMQFRKILITEEIPLCAWYYEQILNELHIGTQVLHSALSTKARDNVVEEFKKKVEVGNLDRPVVLILMYSINAIGVNLDPACYHVIVATAATNAALEIQAWSRVLRVSQKMAVKIYRLCLVNSHDEWRDAVQANKALFDPATKAFSAETLKTLARTLNTTGAEEVKEIRAGPLGKRLLKLLKGLGMPTPGYSAVDEDDDDPFEAHINEYVKKMMHSAQHPLTAPRSNDADDAESSAASGGTSATMIAPDTYNDAEFVASLSGVKQEDMVTPGANMSMVVRPSAGHVEQEGESAPENSGATPGTPAFNHDNDTDNDAMTTGMANTGMTAESDEQSDAEDDDIYALRGVESDDDADGDDESAGELDPEDLEMLKENAAGAGVQDTDREAPALHALSKFTEFAKDHQFGDLHNTTDFTLASRTYWSKEMTDPRVKDRFDQDLIYTLYICTLGDPEKKDYTPEEIKGDYMLMERALRLLHRRRFGMNRTTLRITPYLDYSALNGDGYDIVDKIVVKERTEEDHRGIARALGVEMNAIKKKMSKWHRDRVQQRADGKAIKTRVGAAEEEADVTVEDEVDVYGEDATGGLDIEARLEQIEAAGISDWDLLKMSTGVGDDEATDEGGDGMEVDE